MSTASTEAKSRDGDEPKRNDEERKRLVRYDEYYDYRSYRHRLKKTSKPEKKKNTKGVVLMVRRIIDVKGRLQSTEIDIKSTALVQVLERLNPEVESLELRDPPVADPVLFYHSRVGLRDEYEAEAAKEKPDEELVKALEVALQYIEEDHGADKASMESLLGREEITWKLLWALFVPNKPVYHFHELTQQHQMLRFRKAIKRRDPKTKIEYWQIICDMIVFDGQKFGYVRVDHLRIDEYPGAMKIYDLPVFPVEYFKDNEAMVKKLVDRGKRYAAITGSTYLECEGPAMHEILNEALEPKQFTFSAFGRAMVDADGFRTFEPKASYNYRVYKQLDRDLSSAQFAICSPVVLGFSFGPKLWGALGMDHIHPITWGHAAFPSLVLDPAKKTLLHSLISQHSATSFDDVISGKGLGLIGLLSGRPGCGKTLTAEAISEETRRPLYTVSAGELGTDAREVDARLTLVLELARRWHAILLLDEADVFLHRRSETDVVRNALVSVFLRQLEYFKGILILTTNRIDTFDPAFESRVHFSLHYPDLDAGARRELWGMFLRRAGAAADEGMLDELAAHRLNGRQIKNLVGSALAMARREGVPVAVGHVRAVLEVVGDWTKAVERERKGVGAGEEVELLGL